MGEGEPERGFRGLGGSADASEGPSPPLPPLPLSSRTRMGEGEPEQNLVDSVRSRGVYGCRFLAPLAHSDGRGAGGEGPLAPRFPGAATEPGRTRPTDGLSLATEPRPHSLGEVRCGELDCLML